MRPTTIRLPETTLEALDREYREYGYRDRTEYIRHILDNRDVVIEHTENTEGRSQPTTEEYETLADRLDELEQRVTELENPEPRNTDPIPETIETDTDSAHADLLSYVREHGPVKAGELKEHCYPDDHHLARSTWWTKEAKGRLKESDATYRNNIGWSFE